MSYERLNISIDDYNELKTKLQKSLIFLQEKIIDKRMIFSLHFAQGYH